MKSHTVTWPVGVDRKIISRVIILTDYISISDLTADIKMTFDRENNGEKINFCSCLNAKHFNQCNGHRERIWHQRQVAGLLISNKDTLLENFNLIGPEIFYR